MKEWCRRWDWPRAIGRLRRQAGGRRDEGAAAGHWLPPRVPPTRQGHHTRCSLLTAARCSLIMSVWCRASLPGVGGGDWRERERFLLFCRCLPRSMHASVSSVLHGSMPPSMIHRRSLRTRPVPGTGRRASRKRASYYHMPEQRRGVVVASSEAGARM